MTYALKPAVWIAAIVVILGMVTAAWIYSSLTTPLQPHTTGRAAMDSMNETSERYRAAGQLYSHEPASHAFKLGAVRVGRAAAAGPPDILARRIF